MKSKLSRLGAAIVLGVVAFVLAACTFQAPPPAAQAPQGVLANTPGKVVVVSNAAVTAVTDTVYAAQKWGDYSTADIYWVLTGPTASATTTLVLQDSPDGVSWWTRATLVAAVANSTSYVRVNATGMAFRVERLGTDATSMTTTVKVILK